MNPRSPWIGWTCLRTQQIERRMSNMRKKNKFLLILLTLTLVLAILVTGLGWPGYLLGLAPVLQSRKKRRLSQKATAKRFPLNLSGG